MHSVLKVEDATVPTIEKSVEHPEKDDKQVQKSSDNDLLNNPKFFHLKLI